MPAVGVDGKKIMKLIPVQMVNGQFVHTEISKARTDSTPQKDEDTQSMEIYIPAEAEVKNIPLWSLPSSVLKHMGLPPPDSNSSRKIADSPKGTWICPVVIRSRGQGLDSHTGNSVIKVSDRESRLLSGTCRMSFVTSNRTAYKVLKDTGSGNSVSPHTSHTSLMPQASAVNTADKAVVIYCGRIYLSVRSPKGSQTQQEVREPQPASQFSTPSTSDLSSKKQKKELLNDSRPKKKLTTCKVTTSENKKDFTHKVSSSRTARSVPQSSVHKVDGHCHEAARGEQPREEAAVQEPAWFQPPGEQVVEEVANSDSGEYNMQDLGSQEAESTSGNNDMDGIVQINSGETDQSSNQSWTRSETLGAACASTSLPKDYVYNELEEEEKIARLKARLSQRKAALGSLPSLE
nr:uncharacterized protein LOC109971017 isoform X2 [Monopterus albus]XP_020474666.1 uncharacterized protein LOC109971017 isoform X2 [Monopterus albus]